MAESVVLGVHGDGVDDLAHTCFQVAPAARQPSAASLGLANFSHVDKLGSRYTSVNLGAGKSPGSPKLVRENGQRQR